MLYFEGMGFGKPDSEFVLPISSTHAIHGSWQYQGRLRGANRILGVETELLIYFCQSGPGSVRNIVTVTQQVRYDVSVLRI